MESEEWSLCFAIVYIMKTQRTGLYIISKGIQTDLTMGRWGGITCHHINLSYIVVTLADAREPITILS